MIPFADPLFQLRFQLAGNLQIFQSLNCVVSWMLHVGTLWLHLAPPHQSSASSGSSKVALEAEEAPSMDSYQRTFILTLWLLKLWVRLSRGLWFFIYLRNWHQLHIVTGDPQSYEFLIQRLSVAIQRGNATAVLGRLLILSGHFLNWPQDRTVQSPQPLQLYMEG